MHVALGGGAVAGGRVWRMGVILVEENAESHRDVSGGVSNICASRVNMHKVGMVSCVCSRQNEINDDVLLVGSLRKPQLPTLHISCFSQISF